MHIAMLTPGWPAEGTPNGIATYVQHMRKEFQRQGHRVSVLTGHVHRDTNDPDVYLLREPAWRAFARRIAGRLGRPQQDVALTFGEVIGAHFRQIHKKHPIDVVEMEESFGWCADVQRGAPYPVVVKLHGPAFLSLVEEELETPIAKLKIEAEGRALRTARFVSSPSANTLRQTWEYYGLPKGGERVIFNPMVSSGDTPLWDPERCERKSILFVGRFDKRKGGDFLLRAFRRLLSVDPEYTLTFVGPNNGVKDSSGRTVRIEEFIESTFEPSQRSAVRYLGPLGPAQLTELRLRASVVVVCSRWDNQPNTALEAMVQGCPLVAVESGGMSEVVKHGVTGLLSRNGDEQDFCDKLIEMHADLERAAAMGREARISVREAHSVEKLTAETLSFYRECIERFHQGALRDTGALASTG